jgi:hypothetical protein
MRLPDLAERVETPGYRDLRQAIQDYDARDKARTETWLQHFGGIGSEHP